MITDTELTLGVTVLGRAVTDDQSLEDNLLAAMRAARTEVWWTVDDDKLFRCAIAAVMNHYGPDSDEWRRIKHEVDSLSYLKAGLVVGNLNRLLAHVLADDVPEPIGLTKLWRSTDKEDEHG